MAPTALTKTIGKRKRSASAKEPKEDAGSGSGSESDAQVSGPAATRSKGPNGVAKDSKKEKQPYRQKILILSSRGIQFRQRHLMTDLADLLPHSKKETKLDTRHHLPLINELCFLSSCSMALFFESRRQSSSLYLWMAETPNGPSIRFQVLNIHTMDELNMVGNCLKGSRPVVVFDKEFDEPGRGAEWRLMKDMLTKVFAVPKTARRVKPFVDHIISLSIVDGKIWFRNFQIIKNSEENKKTDGNEQDMSLTEIGPRFVLMPIKIFEGAFCGATIYENKEFTPPSSLAASRRFARAQKYHSRKDAEEVRKVRMEEVERDRSKHGGSEKREIFS